MTKKELLLEQLNEQLRKGEIRDASVITKVELADEKLINSYLEKMDDMKKSMKKDQESSKEDAAEEQAE